MVDLGDGVFILKQIAEPGWVWSECVKPKVGTDSCQKRHIGLCAAGRLSVSNVDGSAMEIGPGEAYVIEPGHNAWVLVKKIGNAMNSIRTPRKPMERTNH